MDQISPQSPGTEITLQTNLVTLSSGVGATPCQEDSSSYFFPRYRPWDGMNIFQFLNECTISPLSFSTTLTVRVSLSWNLPCSVTNGNIIAVYDLLSAPYSHSPISEPGLMRWKRRWWQTSLWVTPMKGIERRWPESLAWGLYGWPLPGQGWGTWVPQWDLLGAGASVP